MIWLTDDKDTDRAMLATDGLSFANGKATPSAPQQRLKRLFWSRSSGTDGKSFLVGSPTCGRAPRRSKGIRARVVAQFKLSHCGNRVI